MQKPCIRLKPITPPNILLWYLYLSYLPDFCCWTGIGLWLCSASADGGHAAFTNPKPPWLLYLVNVVSKPWPGLVLWHHPLHTRFRLSLPFSFSVWLSLRSHLTDAKTPDYTAENDSSFPSLFHHPFVPLLLTSLLCSPLLLSFPLFTELFLTLTFNHSFLVHT